MLPANFNPKKSPAVDGIVPTPTGRVPHDYTPAEALRTPVPALAVLRTSLVRTDNQAGARF